MPIASWGKPEVKVTETIPHLQGWATTGTVTFSVKNDSDGKTLALTFPFQQASSQEAAVQIAAQQLEEVAAAFSQVAARMLNKAESDT